MDTIRNTDVDFAVVYSTSQSYQDVRPGIKKVYIQGYPFLWLFEAILRLGHDVRKILVSPVAYPQLEDECRALCASRGVELAVGVANAEQLLREVQQSWRQRKFFTGLAGEKRNLFAELLAFGFDAAHLAARYFCLNGEDYILEADAAAAFGLPPSAVSDGVNAICIYLNSAAGTAGAESERMAGEMRVNVRRFRKYLTSEFGRKAFAWKLGLASMPVDLPLARYAIYEKLVPVWRSGSWREIAVFSPWAVAVMTCRYGFESYPHRYRTLEETRAFLGLESRAQVRQFEDSALEMLGLKEAYPRDTLENEPDILPTVMITDMVRVTLSEAITLLGLMRDGSFPPLDEFRRHLDAGLLSVLEDWGYFTNTGVDLKTWESTFFKVEPGRQRINAGKRVYKFTDAEKGRAVAGSWLTFLREGVQRST